jgi:hypothetical protein
MSTRDPPHTGHAGNSCGGSIVWDETFGVARGDGDSLIDAKTQSVWIIFGRAKLPSLAVT